MSARRKPNQERSRAMVDAILEGCARVLLEDGYDRASTNRIARAAGVSVGSLYQYFPGLDAIVAALYQGHHRALCEALCRGLLEAAAAPPERAGACVARALMTPLRDRPDLRREVLEQGLAAGAERKVGEARARAARAVQGFLEARGAPARLPREAAALRARLLVHAVEGAARAATLGGPEVIGDPALEGELAALIGGYLTAP
jgi:AcrR family transcriptional regulator